MEDRADRRQLFWWAFYGTIDTEKDMGEIQMMNVLFNQLGFLCLRGDNPMKCKQRQGADVDCLSAIYRTISGWGCWKTQQLLVPLCPFTAPCQRVPKHCSQSHPLNRRATSLFNHPSFREGNGSPGRIQKAFLTPRFPKLLQRWMSSAPAGRGQPTSTQGPSSTGQRLRGGQEPPGMRSLPSGPRLWRRRRFQAVSFQSKASPSTEWGLSDDTALLEWPHRLVYLVFGQISSFGRPLGCASCEAASQGGIRETGLSDSLLR